MIFDPWEVVVVPFPFTEGSGSKRRPALVISNKHFNQDGHTILAMITSTGHHPWPGDTIIKNTDAAGLPRPCMVRLKLFTLDNRVIIKRLGSLSHDDRERVARSLKSFVVHGG